MGYLANYCSVSPHFSCNGISYWNVDLCKKMTQIRSVGGEMRKWWWKIGFTPRAIRHVRRNWLFSSLDAISSYLWVISLIVASWGTSTQFTFLKHPPLGPQMTTSGKMHGTHTLIYARTHMQLKLTNHTKHTHAHTQTHATQIQEPHKAHTHMLLILTNHTSTHSYSRTTQSTHTRSSNTRITHTYMQLKLTNHTKHTSMADPCL